MRDIPGTAGPWPGWAPGDPWPSSTGAALPPSPSSLRAELAEAKAEIARLTEVLEQGRSGWDECLSILGRATDQLATQKPIVEAATALRDYDAQFAYPGDQWVSRREQLVRAVVTAVEEGNRTDESG